MMGKEELIENFPFFEWILSTYLWWTLPMEDRSINRAILPCQDAGYLSPRVMHVTSHAEIPKKQGLLFSFQEKSFKKKMVN